MTYLGGLSKMEGNHRKYVNGIMFQFTNILKCEEKFPLCRFLPLTSPLSPAPLLLLPNPGLRGGKGGFGSLLRAIGAQVEHLQSGKMKRIHGLSFLDRGNNQPRGHEGPHWQEATGRQQ